MFRLAVKILLCMIIILIFLSGAVITGYLKVLPGAVENPKVINLAKQLADKYAGVDLEIKNPRLITKLSPEIDFSISALKMSKDNNLLLDLENIDSSISLKDVFDKKIIINKLGADRIFADINKIISAFSKEEKEPQKFDWIIDFYNSLLFINDSYIIYNPDKNTKIRLKASDIKLDNTVKDAKYLHFNFDADISNAENNVNIAFKDENKVAVQDGHISIKDCPFIINKSKMFFDAVINKDNTFDVEVYADRFFIPDVIKLLQTNIVPNNINDVLKFLKNINGDFNFRVKITDKALSGIVNINKCSSMLVPLSDMPLSITGGDIIINKKDISLKNFKGYYAGRQENQISFDGTVKDYAKTAETNIEMKAHLTDDFVDKYLSKTAGLKLALKGSSNALILVHALGTGIDVSLMGKIAKGYDILVEGASFSPIKYDRALRADIHVKDDNLNIEKIDYFIGEELNKESKGKVKPILTLDGNIRISDGKLLDLGFDIKNPLPSEFLNVLISRKLFRGGKFSGSLKLFSRGGYPKIKGNITADKIRIPSRRLFLNHGEFTTDREELHINADGRYRRCSYTFNGNLLNGIKLPIVVTSTTLTVDDVNIEKVLKSLSKPPKPVEKIDNVYVEENTENDGGDEEPFEFDFDNIIVENAAVKILKGEYKDIKFSNVIANMSLKDSIFKLKSNRFEIAEGHSSADVNCDLKNQKYNVRLGIKDVNSDIISSTILNLPKEISGKASGLIDLNTDNSFKLNGNIKFAIKDGTIQKIGLVEYALKFAALFRNPFAMISPSVFTDLVNIPEGNFDKITGDIKMKNNIIELMKIKSYSPYLSAFIIGRYNMENSDAVLRIYTKFTNRKKGFAGFLRYLSLSSLANRIPLNSRNDSNYYEAELSQLPDIEADEKDCQVFLTKVDGDIEHNNFISLLKKIQ